MIQFTQWLKSDSSYSIDIEKLIFQFAWTSQNFDRVTMSLKIESKNVTRITQRLELFDPHWEAYFGRFHFPDKRCGLMRCNGSANEHAHSCCGNWNRKLKVGRGKLPLNLLLQIFIIIKKNHSACRNPSAQSKSQRVFTTSVRVRPYTLDFVKPPSA